MMDCPIEINGAITTRDPAIYLASIGLMAAWLTSYMNTYETFLLESV